MQATIYAITRDKGVLPIFRGLGEKIQLGMSTDTPSLFLSHEIGYVIEQVQKKYGSITFQVKVN